MFKMMGKKTFTILRSKIISSKHMIRFFPDNKEKTHSPLILHSFPFLLSNNFTPKSTAESIIETLVLKYATFSPTP